MMMAVMIISDIDDVEEDSIVFVYDSYCYDDTVIVDD